MKKKKPEISQAQANRNLFYAAVKNDPKKVLEALKQGATLDFSYQHSFFWSFKFSSHCGWNALHFLASYGDVNALNSIDYILKWNNGKNMAYINEKTAAPYLCCSRGNETVNDIAYRFGNEKVCELIDWCKVYYGTLHQENYFNEEGLDEDLIEGLSEEGLDEDTDEDLDEDLSEEGSNRGLEDERLKNRKIFRKKIVNN